MSFLLEIVWQFLLEFVVAAPGAFVLWGLRGFKGRYRTVLKGDLNKSTVIGIGLWIGLLILVGLINQHPSRDG